MPAARARSWGRGGGVCAQHATGSPLCAQARVRQQAARVAQLRAARHAAALPAAHLHRRAGTGGRLGVAAAAAAAARRERPRQARLRLCRDNCGRGAAAARLGCACRCITAAAAAVGGRCLVGGCRGQCQQLLFADTVRARDAHGGAVRRAVRAARGSAGRAMWLPPGCSHADVPFRPGSRRPVGQRRSRSTRLSARLTAHKLLGCKQNDEVQGFWRLEGRPAVATATPGRRAASLARPTHPQHQRHAPRASPPPPKRGAVLHAITGWAT